MTGPSVPRPVVWDIRPGGGNVRLIGGNSVITAGGGIRLTSEFVAQEFHVGYLEYFTFRFNFIFRSNQDNKWSV